MNNIQEKTKKILNEQLIKKKAEDNKKFRSTLKNIVLKMEKNGKFIDKAENDIKLYAKMFVEKITNKLKKKTDKIKSNQ